MRDQKIIHSQEQQKTHSKKSKQITSRTQHTGMKKS